MLIAMFCRLAPRMPAAMIPAMKYWVKRHAGADVVVQHRPEDHQQQHRQQQGEDHRLALPEELLELHRRPRAVDRASDGSGRVGRGRRVIGPLRSSAGTRPRAWAGRRPGPGPRRGTGPPAPARTPSASRSPRVRRTPSSVQLTTAGRRLPAAERRRDGDLDQPAAGDDPDPVGQRLGLVQVVGGEQHRGAELAQRPDQRPELPAGLRVEAGRRLVEEQQGRAGRRCRARRPAGAAGRRTATGRATPRLLGEPDQLEHLVGVARVGVVGGPGGAASRARSAGCRRRSTAARCPAAPSSARAALRGSSPSTRTSPASRSR